MFSYDALIAAAVQATPKTIPGVLDVMRKIDHLCVDLDGLRWFNGLYLAVTEAVENRVTGGGFADGAWLAELDVQFAGLYFSALRNALSGAACPGCWAAMFGVRDNVRLARIQFALAGVNAHINHDLCLAIVETCKVRNTIPRHGTAQYGDYTALNSTLDSLIEQAKKTLNVRLPGDPLPPVTHVEDTIAAWNVAAARETAWKNAECLWNFPLLRQGLMDGIDGFTAVIGKTLLVAA